MSIRKPAIIVAAVVLLAGCATTSVPDAVPVLDAQPATVQAAAPLACDDIQTVAGTVRWVNSTTWVAIDDAGHTPTNIGTIEVLPDRLRVNYTFTADQVSTVAVTPDDAFASANVRVGASVGLAYMDIYFYMSGSARVFPGALSKAGANVWIYGQFHKACLVQ